MSILQDFTGNLSQTLRLRRLIQGSEVGVCSLLPRVQDLGFRVWGLGLRSPDIHPRPFIGVFHMSILQDFSGNLIQTLNLCPLLQGLEVKVYT